MVWLTSEYAAMAQSVERVLGKDEVSSSNLDSSSKKHRNRGAFLFIFSFDKHSLFSPCAIHILMI